MEKRISRFQFLLPVELCWGELQVAKNQGDSLETHCPTHH